MAETAKEGNISLILDDYSDIFSDFDPRPYGTRALSTDFLQECKNASREKGEGGIELRLLVPKAKRNAASEAAITKRIRHHFSKHHDRLLKERKQVKNSGMLWVVVGIALTLLATMLYQLGGFLNTLLLVLFEPGGWFCLWTGLDKIVTGSNANKANIEFYKKMKSASVVFSSY